MEGNGFLLPEGIEKSDINRLQTAMKMNSLDCPFGEHLEHKQHEIA